MPLNGPSPRTTREIQKVLDQIQERVNLSDPDAEIIWDTLQWVIGVEEEDPYTRFFMEDDAEAAAKENTASQDVSTQTARFREGLAQLRKFATGS